MLLVILGAGASYDSAPSRPPNDGNYSNLPNRPPLANELFGDRPYFGEVMNKYPRCLSIIPRLRHISEQSSVEVELQKLQAEATAYSERYCQLAAIRYYLQDILWDCGGRWMTETHHVSNYLTLVDDIKRWKKPGDRVCFVTFNYDNLLDLALRRTGYPFTELSAYTARDLMLVKLHGSVNWARMVRTPFDENAQVNRVELATRLIDQYPILDISRDFVLIGEYPPSPRIKKPVFPALAIPVEEKLDFECPAEHVEALKSFLPNVTKILVIGWRATEKPFLEILKSGLGGRNPDITIVNGLSDNSQVAANNLQKVGITGKFRILNEGFTDFIRRDSGRVFLSS